MKKFEPLRNYATYLWKQISIVVGGINKNGMDANYL